MTNQQLRRNLSELTDSALTTSLITIAILTIVIAIFVRNKWIKAGVLAYEILP